MLQRTKLQRQILVPAEIQMFIGVGWSFSWTKYAVRDADLTDDLRPFEPVEWIIIVCLMQIVAHNLQT